MVYVVRNYVRVLWEKKIRDLLSRRKEKEYHALNIFKLYLRKI